MLHLSRILFAFLMLILISPDRAIGSETIDPDDSGRQYAWSENGGWLNAEPMGDGGPGMQIVIGRASGWLWMENFGWVSLNCANTGSCNDVSYHVLTSTIEGQPNHYALTGYGWAENIGWISFSCENTNSCPSVDYSVNLSDQGILSGFAWSENVGWISFDCSNTASCKNVEFGVTSSLPAPLTGELFMDGFENL